MKTAKKLFSVLLAFVMVLALVVPAFAVGEDSDTTTGSITITNPIEGVTYTAYKIFDVTYSPENNPTAYAYTIGSDSPWFSVVYDSDTSTSTVTGLTFTESATEGIYIVTANTNFSAADLAKTLGEAVAEDASGTYTIAATLGPKTATSTETTLTESNLALGYYFVYNNNSGTEGGALFSLDTTNPTAEIRDKNQLPQIDKKVTDDKDADQYGDSTSASVGDTVYFQVTITTEAGTDADGNAVAKGYVLHDKMTDGLTFNEESVIVKLNNTTVTNTNDSAYTVTTPGTETTGDECTFEVEFKSDFLKDLNAYDQIVISYSATVNEDAVTVDEVKNTATLNFGDNQKIDTEKDPTKIKTYSFDLIKTGPALADATSGDYQAAAGETTTYYNKLEGAKFKLYNTETGGTEIVLVQGTDTEGNTYYRPATADEQQKSDFTAAVIEAGQATIKGLAADTYYLEETETPDGYNPLKGRVEVEIKDANLSFTSVENSGILQDGIQVINETGAELPSTGGMGTTIFYVIGGVLVVAAIVLLVTRKRMNNAD